MTDKRTQQDAENSNMAKDPDEWVTANTDDGSAALILEDAFGGSPQSFDDNLTKAEASKRIEELQQKTGRGLGGAEGPNGKSR